MKCYPKLGRIEDYEVIQKHREREKRYRDNNAIVEPPASSPSITTAKGAKSYFVC
jgi:hypothetical protein